MKKTLISITCFFCVCFALLSSGQTIQVTIDITTDQWGNECFWQLDTTGDGCGNSPVFSGGNTAVGCDSGCVQAQPAGGYASNSVITEGPFTLTEGQDYDIEYVDDWGDGGATFEVKVGCAVIKRFIGSGCGNTFTFTASQNTHDIELTQTFFNLQNIPPDLDDSSSMLYYSMIPLRQATSDTLFFTGEIKTPGASYELNTVLDVVISGAGTFSGSSTPDTVDTCVSNYLRLPTYFIPSNPGVHNIDFTISMDSTDQDTTNNFLSAGVPGQTTFDVTDSVWARDNGNPGDSLWYGAAVLYKIGNLFQLNLDDTAASISYYFAQSNPVGASVQFHLWDSSLSVPVASSALYTLTVADQGAWVTLPFASGTTLDSNNHALLASGNYVAGIETMSDTTSFTVGANAPDAPPQTSFVDMGITGSWEYMAQTPFIRLNMKSAICGTFSATLDTAINESIPGANDGSATVIASGGTPSYTYLWSSGDTLATATGLTADTYTCTITDQNGCTKVITVVIVVTDVYENALQSSIIVFPNPSGGKFTLRWSNALKGDYQLIISNLIGQVVYSERYIAGNNLTKQFDLKWLGKGVYFLSVSAPGGTSTHKLIIGNANE